MAQNLSTASKKAIQQSKLNQLDILGESKENFETGLLSTIENVAGDFIQRVIDNIQQEDMVVSGKIADIRLQSENGEVKVYANPWLIYQDKGVNGSIVKRYNTPFSYKDKMPPVEIFKDYIKAKNIQLRNNTTYYGNASPYANLTDDEQIEKAAWGMAMKVFREGIKPRNVYTKELDQLVQDVNENVGEFVKENISQLLAPKQPINININL